MNYAKTTKHISSMKVDYKQNPVLKQLSDVFYYEIIEQQAKTWPFLKNSSKKPLLGKEVFHWNAVA